MTSEIIQYLEKIPHNSHQLSRYIKFLTFCLKADIAENTYTEKHHILPKSLFPEFADLKKFRWNEIKLTYAQHFIAHRILWKAYGGAMALAFQMFNGKQSTKYKRRLITNKVYSELRIQVQEDKKQRKWWNNQIKEFWLSPTAIKPESYTLGRIAGVSTISENNIEEFLKFHNFDSLCKFRMQLENDVLVSKLSISQLNRKWKTTGIRQIGVIWFLKKYNLQDKITKGIIPGRLGGFKKYKDSDYEKTVKTYFGFDSVEEFKFVLTKQVNSGFSSKELKTIYKKKKPSGRLPQFINFLEMWNLKPIHRTVRNKIVYACTPDFCYISSKLIEDHSVVALCIRPDSLITRKRYLTNDHLLKNFTTDVIGRTPRELGFFQKELLF